MINLFVKNKFLSDDECNEFIDSDSQFRSANVVNKKGEKFVNADYRNTQVRDLKNEQSEQLFIKFTNIQKDIEQTFDMQLEGLFSFQVLQYEKGHFFKKHRDVNGLGENERRKITVIIYLNEPGGNDQTDSYEGGTLIVYGVHSKFMNSGMPIATKKGMLVAFPSRLIHEVTPITSGTRRCIVNWYY